MAIDANILLRGIVPDVGRAVQQGLNIGSSIRNAPILRRLNEQKVAQGEQQARLQEQNMLVNDQRMRINDQSLASGELDQGEKEAMAMYSLFKDIPVTSENFGRIVSNAARRGISMEDFTENTPENVENLNWAIQEGGRLFQGGQKGGLASAKTEIYPNGTAVQGLPDGSVDVKDPSGKSVFGEERLKVLEAAQQSKINAASGKESAIITAKGQAEANTPAGRLKIQLDNQKLELDKSIANLAQQELKVKRSEAIAAADDTVMLIDSLLTHPGRKGATGTSALLPTRPGGRSADFEADFNRLKGSAFLEAVQKLKGSGQISNTEGEAATASVLGIELGQSEEGFIENLKSLRARIIEAKKRRSGMFENEQSGGKVIPTITTQAEFDALQPGAEFIEDGKKMVKR